MCKICISSNTFYVTSSFVRMLQNKLAIREVKTAMNTCHRNCALCHCLLIEFFAPNRLNSGLFVSSPFFDHPPLPPASFIKEFWSAITFFLKNITEKLPILTTHDHLSYYTCLIKYLDQLSYHNFHRNFVDNNNNSKSKRHLVHRSE